MQYNYTCENELPVNVTLTYEDLMVIRRMARVILAMEEIQPPLYRGDIMKLEMETVDALKQVANKTRVAFHTVDTLDD